MDNTLKALLTKMWNATKSLFSSSFYILKDGVMALVLAIYNWCVTIVKGLGSILWSGFETTGSATIKKITEVYNKVTAWIKKW